MTVGCPNRRDTSPRIRASPTSAAIDSRKVVMSAGVTVPAPSIVRFRGQLVGDMKRAVRIGDQGR